MWRQKEGIEQEGAERTEKTTFDFLGSARDPVAKLGPESTGVFPKLSELHQVTLKVLRWEERDKVLMIRSHLINIRGGGRADLWAGHFVARRSQPAAGMLPPRA
jgi:hypothetical protein